MKHPPTGERLDRQVLYISRVATVVILVLCAAIAWAWVDTNVLLIVWIGTGGIMSAFAGSLVFGALWRGVTRAGAYAGLVSGFVSFLVLHAQLIDPAWFTPGLLHSVVSWLYIEGVNPFSCSALASLTSVVFTVVVSQGDPAVARTPRPGTVRGRVKRRGGFETRPYASSDLLASEPPVASISTSLLGLSHMIPYRKCRRSKNDPSNIGELQAKRR